MPSIRFWVNRVSLEESCGGGEGTGSERHLPEALVFPAYPAASHERCLLPSVFSVMALKVPDTQCGPVDHAWEGGLDLATVVLNSWGPFKECSLSLLRGCLARLGSSIEYQEAPTHVSVPPGPARPVRCEA